MGLDQRIVWVGKASTDLIKRVTNKNISLIGTYGMEYIYDDDIKKPRYDAIRKYFKPTTIYINSIDWDKIKKDCGVSLDAHLCGISNNEVSFGEAMNLEHKTFEINLNADKYKKIEKVEAGFALMSNVYEWHNAYDIQTLWDEQYGIEDEDNNKRIENCKYYKLTKAMFNKMCKIDPKFKEVFGNDDIENMFYQADW